MAQYSVKPMTEADLPEVILLESQVYAFPWSRRNFLDSIQANYHMSCMCLEDRLAGYIVMMPVLKEFHLLNLSIRLDLQGQGYGRQLLSWGIAQARQAQASGMLLEVRPSNAVAKNLYETEGFKLIGLRKNYYPSPSGREDAWVMLKRFEEVVCESSQK